MLRSYLVLIAFFFSTLCGKEIPLSGNKKIVSRLKLKRFLGKGVEIEYLYIPFESKVKSVFNSKKSLTP